MDLTAFMEVRVGVDEFLITTVCLDEDRPGHGVVKGISASGVHEYTITYVVDEEQRWCEVCALPSGNRVDFHLAGNPAPFYTHIFCEDHGNN